MLYAFYNRASYTSAADAQAKGGLYESANPLTYTDAANQADVLDVVFAALQCVGATDIAACTIDDNGNLKELAV
jgi:hypothetical protein